MWNYGSFNRGHVIFLIYADDIAHEVESDLFFTKMSPVFRLHAAFHDIEAKLNGDFAIIRNR